METPKKKNSIEVDKILDELKGKKPEGLKADTAALNDILEGMGLEKLAPGKKYSGAKKPAANPVPVQKPSPSPVAANADNPPRQQEGKQPPLHRPSTQKVTPTSSEETLFQPPKAKDKTERTATRTLPDFGTTIELDGPRLGKATALEKVDRDKFTGDEELLSWFNNTQNDGALSPREERRAQKEQKKQQSVDAKAEKRRTKSGDTQPMPAGFPVKKPAENTVKEPAKTVPADWSGIAPAAAQPSVTVQEKTPAPVAKPEAPAKPEAKAPPAHKEEKQAPKAPRPTLPQSPAPLPAAKAAPPMGAKPQGVSAPQPSVSRPLQRGLAGIPSQSPHPQSGARPAQTTGGAAAPSSSPQPATRAAATQPRPQGTTARPPVASQGTKQAQPGARSQAAPGTEQPGSTKPRPKMVIPLEALATRNVPVAPPVQIMGKQGGETPPAGTKPQGTNRPPQPASLQGQIPSAASRPGPPASAQPARPAVPKPAQPAAKTPPAAGTRPPQMAPLAQSAAARPRASASTPGQTAPKITPPNPLFAGAAAAAAAAQATEVRPKPPDTPAKEAPGKDAQAASRSSMTAPSKSPAGKARPTPSAAKVTPSAEGEYVEVEAKGSTLEIDIKKITQIRSEQAELHGKDEEEDTQSFALDEHEATRVPTAAHTKEFDSDGKPLQETGKNLFIDEMVDERFHDFFGNTVIVEREELEEAVKRKPSRRGNAKRSRTALITGEFARLAEQAEAENDEDFEDYNRPQDAQAVERDILLLRANLTRRTVISAVLAGWLVYMSLGFSGILPLPDLLDPAVSGALLFCVFYVAVLAAGLILNFTTVATGLVGLVGEPTVDTSSGLAGVAALLQAVVLIVQLLTGQPVAGTLFGCAALLLLTFNALGKRIRASAILENFRIASAGLDHSAAYVLDGGHEVAYNITSGLEEDDPSILISRPTALVKGFLRQSFSQRWSDRVSRVLGWVLLAVAALSGVLCYLQTKDMMLAISAFAGAFAIAAPLSSTLLAAMPSILLQKSTTKVGAVVPGWSAIEELGKVNVVMAQAKDVFPAGSVHLRGIKTFEKERVDLAILYAASVLVEGCETLRNVFLAVIQNNCEMLYKVENMLAEPSRGFSAWVEHNRVVIGTREMLQKHGISPPSLELEMKFVPEGHLPVYLAVSGRLFAMFILRYTPDIEVQDTLDGLVRSGVSLLVTSGDMNVTGELIQQVYSLPEGVVKVMGKRELDLLEPLQSYLPESEGVMTHIGSFASFIGGMRAAAGCAAAERMSVIVQIAAAALACLLCLLLAYSGSLATLAISIVILYQVGWTVLVSALPFARRY